MISKVIRYYSSNFDGFAAASSGARALRAKTQIDDASKSLPATLYNGPVQQVTLTLIREWGFEPHESPS